MQEIKEPFLSESIYKYYYEFRFYLNVLSVLITAFIPIRYFLKNLLNFSSIVKRKLVSQNFTFFKTNGI